ncbi:MAG: outer membrane beta-barrel protein [Bacteroidaceae bacterium]|nr:outer membrane beta-barrel protein [Bacteroidaceae bacterium]
MAEKWKENLRNKFDGFESADIPEGLWAGIENRLDAVEPLAAENREPKRAFSLVWSRSAAVVILLMVALNCGMMRCFYTYISGEIEGESLSLADDKLLREEPRRASRARMAEIGKAEIISNVAEDEDSVSAEKTVVKNVAVSSSAAVTEKKDTVVENVRSEKKKAWYVSKNSTNISKAKKTKLKPSVSMYVSGITIDTDFLNGYDEVYDAPSDYPVSGNPKYDDSGLGSYIEKEYEEHSRPIYVGLEVAFPIDDKWSFQTGLVYSELCSTFDKGAVHTDQTIRYLNIPLKLGINLTAGKKWNIYASGGMMVGFGVGGKAEIQKPSANYGRVSMTQRLNGIPVTASVVASPGFEFRLFRGLNAYAEPSLMFNIPTSEKYHTFNTENLFVFNLGVGLRYKIGK